MWKSYSIPKGPFVGEEKFVVMDYTKLQIVQGPKLVKQHAICSTGFYPSPQCHTATFSNITQMSVNVPGWSCDLTLDFKTSHYFYDKEL